MTKPSITIPQAFAIDGVKTDFDNTKIQNGFDKLQPDVLAGDNLNKFIDDTYKGLNGVLDLYKGAVLYDVNETYTNKSIIFNIDENNEIKIYRSLTNNNIGNDLDDTDYWEEVSLGGGATWGSIQGDINDQTDLYNNLKYTRYAVNSGSVDENGKPNYLELLTVQGEVRDTYEYPHNLTSDGVIGESEIACFLKPVYAAGNEAYHMFDGVNTEGAQGVATINNAGYFGWWCKTPNCVTQVKIVNTNYGMGLIPLGAGSLEASNDTTNGEDGTWTTLATWTNDDVSGSAGGEWFINCPDNTTDYHAYRLKCPASTRQRIGEVYVTATYQVSGQVGSTLLLNADTVITDSSDTYNVVNTQTLDMSEYPDGQYKIWFNKGNLLALQNKLITDDIYLSNSIITAPFIQPTLTEDGTLGGDTFAVSVNAAIYNNEKAYYPFSAEANTSASKTWLSSGNNAEYTIYNPVAIKISSLGIANRNESNARAVRSGTVYGSNDGETWNELFAFTNDIVTKQEQWDIEVNSAEYYKYYKLAVANSDSYIGIGKITINAEYLVGQVNEGDIIQPSTEPLQRYIRQNNERVKCDYVLLGDVTVTDGVVSIDSVEPFNRNYYDVKATSTPVIVDKYINGTSWYKIWSDGWKQQGGHIATTQTIKFLKPFSNLNYTLSLATVEKVQGNGLPNSIYSNKEPTGVYVHCDYISNDRNGGADWMACGY